MRLRDGSSTPSKPKTPVNPYIRLVLSPDQRKRINDIKTTSKATKGTADSLLVTRAEPPATKLQSKTIGAKQDTVVVTHARLVGETEDRQRSRLRFINRNIPPRDFTIIGQHRPMSVPRRWR